MWEQPLGEGWSSPAVAGGRVFVTDRVSGDEHLLAFDAASGRELWRTRNPVDFDPHAVGRRHGSGPKSTPCTDGRRVYSLGIAGWLQCVDAETGKLVWKHNLPAEFTTPERLSGDRAYVDGTERVVVPIGDGQGGAVPLFGYTGSLLLTDEKLILSVGGDRGATIMAFDAETGQPAWKALDEHVSYSSPIVATLAGERQVVAMTGPRVVGLRVTDGKLLWSHPFQIQYDESISTPAVSEQAGLVLVTGDSRPLTALAITRDGDSFAKRVAWENTDLSSYLSSMVVVGEHVYGMADDGQFACIALADGTTQWQGGNHGYYSSPIMIGSRLLALNEEGELLVLAAKPAKYQELGASTVAASATWTMPAPAADRIYVRSADRLACFRLKSD